MAAFGAPHYFAAHPPPKSPHDLRAHRCINLRLPKAGVNYKWEFERGMEKMEVAVEGPLAFDDPDLVVDAALAGAGIGFTVDDNLQSLFEAGALVRVLGDWTPPSPGFFLYYPSRRQISPALAAFVDAVRFRNGKGRVGHRKGSGTEARPG